MSSGSEKIRKDLEELAIIIDRTILGYPCIVIPLTDWEDYWKIENTKRGFLDQKEIDRLRAEKSAQAP